MKKNDFENNFDIIENVIKTVEHKHIQNETEIQLTLCRNENNTESR